MNIVKNKPRKGTWCMRSNNDQENKLDEIKQDSHNHDAISNY